LTLVATTGAQAMDSDASGWLWLVIDVLMVAGLGVAFFTGACCGAGAGAVLLRKSVSVPPRSSMSAKPNVNEKPKPIASAGDAPRSKRNAPKAPMYAPGSKQPNEEPDKGWGILLGSLIFVALLLLCAVWYARALECPWPSASPPEIAMLVCADTGA